MSIGGLTAGLRALPGAIWILLIALIVWAVYGNGHVGYDGMYSLVWGNDLVHGRSPDFETQLAPTPHPLAILGGAVLSLFGDAALPMFQAVIVVSFAALGWFAYRMGNALFSAAVGVLFLAILLTRKLLVVEVLQASIDIPFLALVLWAAFLEAQRPRRGAPVLVLLSVAGLLRPEAWLLAGVYLLYLLPVLAPPQRWRLGALAASAPVLWALFDLAITGDPLFSLHGTQDLAAQLDRPRELDTALETAPTYLKFTLYEPVMWGGIVGALMALYALYERSLLPAAVAGLGLLAFVVLGPLGLPLLIRYLLVPAAMLGLFCAVGVFGWLNLPRGATLRYAWGAGAVVLAAALILSIPDDSRRLRSVQAWTDLQREVQKDLHDVVSTPAAEASYRRCSPPMYVPNHRVVPLLAYLLEGEPDSFVSGPVSERGVVLTPRTDIVAASLVLDAREERPPPVPPRGFRLVSANGSWLLSARC